MEKENFYLGLDIGTDSVGYAATTPNYTLKKYKGEPVWGVTTFKAGSDAAGRRASRIARRRLERRKQRITLTNEIFAEEISKIDPKFFIRLQESNLYRDEASEPFALFNDPDYKDADYHKAYPTIHHLIVDLMQSSESHDVRLVYLAVAWLISHRGHFLFDIADDNVSDLLDFDRVYSEFKEFMLQNYAILPWDSETPSNAIRAILIAKLGVKKKTERFKNEIFHGEKLPKTVEPDGAYPYSVETLVNLLCGGKVKPEDLFQTGQYAEVDSVSLNMDDETFARIAGEMDDDGELLLKLRALNDCAMLITAQNGKATISEAKIELYRQHAEDLKWLKYFIKKYNKEKYDEVFRDSAPNNYVAWSYNVKNCDKATILKKAKKEDFSKYLKSILQNILKENEVKSKDQKKLEDALNRLDLGEFLPKQRDTDNRVIPHQLYRYELAEILKHAEAYLPFLKTKDSDGLTPTEKLLSIFSFKIPYFVGPLCNYHNKNAWMERKAEGKILPWNFEEKVDLDKSEEAFIDNLINNCTYLPGEPVLPVKSLLYEKFKVLNEINNLKVSGNPIPVEAKQHIYTELFMDKRRVTLKQIAGYLTAIGCPTAEDDLSGVDAPIKSSLSSYHSFRRLLENRALTELQVEDIIYRAAYSEDKNRFRHWLKAKYPILSEADCCYISGLNLKEFGRLSGRFLTGICEPKVGTGEAISIIDALWETNENLMQLLSEHHTFKDRIKELRREYYAEYPADINTRMAEMYISPAVRRPIVRTLEICDDVVKAMKCPPAKIFVEMARGATEDQKGKRTSTRKKQLLDLYKEIKTGEARELEKELEAMGVMADNMLQGDKLFLYYLQMGKCAYTGRPIDLTHLSDGTYNIEHIYPRSLVKDDSILNNKVLVESQVNGEKSDIYPVPQEIRNNMKSTWTCWKKAGLITEEKYNRLTRTTRFTEEERWAFINRQLVETRQSTKAVAELLKEKYPETEIVYVKAGMVSEFRQKYDMLKSRQLNCLHHAKDAYLNVVVGNVYHEKFSNPWFNIDGKYSLNTEEIFKRPVKHRDEIIWPGAEGIASVRKVLAKNAMHVTRYAYCQKGQLFDVQPVKAKADLVPLKAGRNPEKYGGYNKATASFFMLVKYIAGKKSDMVILPIELMDAERYERDPDFAEEYTKQMVQRVWGSRPDSVKILRKIKVNTVLSLNGLRGVISSKSSGGKSLTFSLLTQVCLDPKLELYVKLLERFEEKRKENPNILPDEAHDHITADDNIKLYQAFKEKFNVQPYRQCPGNLHEVLQDGETAFLELQIIDQVSILMNILSWFSPDYGGCDLTKIKGCKSGGSKKLGANLSTWKKYGDARIIDMSASGIYESRSENLLNLL